MRNEKLLPVVGKNSRWLLLLTDNRKQITDLRIENLLPVVGENSRWLLLLTDNCQLEIGNRY